MVGKEKEDSFKGALCRLCRKLVPAFCYYTGALPRRVTWYFPEGSNSHNIR